MPVEISHGILSGGDIVIEKLESVGKIIVAVSRAIMDYHVRLLLVPCMYHESDFISFQTQQPRAHENSSATFGLRPNVFLSTFLIVSRKIIKIFHC